MKKMSNKIKAISLLIAIIIIAGIIIITTLGFNFELGYQASKKVEIYIGKEFEVSDIKQITNEVMQNQAVMIQKVEAFEDTVSIISKDITEEQKSNLVTKINEKYQVELSAEEIDITSIPHTRGRDIIKPYIVPFIIATVIILCYMAVRYYKLNSIKIIIKAMLILIISEALLFSLIAITRLPIGRLTASMMLTVYILALLGITNKFEKDLELNKAQEEKE